LWRPGGWLIAIRKALTPWLGGGGDKWLHDAPTTPASCLTLRAELDLQRKAQLRDAAAVFDSVLECQRATMRFGNLTAEHQANTGASRFRGEKGNKQIRGI
jgi:hypothetical protein